MSLPHRGFLDPVFGLFFQVLRRESLLDGVHGLAHVGAGAFDLGPGRRHLVDLRVVAEDVGIAIYRVRVEGVRCGIKPPLSRKRVRGPTA